MGDPLQTSMTRDDVYKLISESIGKSVKEAVEPLRQRDSVARDLVEAIRESVSGKIRGKTDNSAWRAIRAIAASKARNWGEVVQYVNDSWKDKEFSKYLDTLSEKALAAGEATAGGVLLPTDLAAEVIDLLRSKAVVRSLGATTIDMPNGSLEIPRMTGGAAVGWVAENAARNATQPSFGNVVLTARKLVGIVPASNDLLRSPRSNADTLIRNDLSRGMALKEDLSFIRGDGTTGAPKGMRYWAKNVTTAGTPPDLSEMIVEFRGMLTRIQTNDVDINDAAWIMAPRTREYLRTVRGVDVFLFRQEIDAGRLFGIPLGVTSQIPVNLGDGSDETELYLVNMADAIIGETGAMEIAASSEAAYNDSTGTVVAPFSRDQTVIRVLERVDFAMRHDESVEVLSGIHWGGSGGS